MPSGKQILHSLFQEYSQTYQDERELDEVSKNIRAALLLHCSTAEETWYKVEKMGWVSEADQDGQCIRQGLGFPSQGIFLSDLFEAMCEDESLPESVKTRFPSLTQEDYRDALFIMWYLFSSLQYWEELTRVENNGKLDVSERKYFLENMRKKLRLFKEDPDDFLGKV